MAKRNRNTNNETSTSQGKGRRKRQKTAQQNTEHLQRVPKPRPKAAKKTRGTGKPKAGSGMAAGQALTQGLNLIGWKPKHSSIKVYNFNSPITITVKNYGENTTVESNDPTGTSTRTPQPKQAEPEKGEVKVPQKVVSDMEEQTPPSLRITSYNVRSLIKEVYPKVNADNRHQLSEKAMQGWIGAQDSDIILLQDVGGKHQLLENIERVIKKVKVDRAGYKSTYGVITLTDGTTTGSLMTIYSKSSKDFSSMEIKALNCPPDNGITTIKEEDGLLQVLEVNLERTYRKRNSKGVKNSTKKTYNALVCNLYLRHSGSNYEKQAYNTLRDLENCLESYPDKKHVSNPIVIGGDFNVELSENLSLKMGLQGSSTSPPSPGGENRERVENWIQSIQLLHNLKDMASFLEKDTKTWREVVNGKTREKRLDHFLVKEGNTYSQLIETERKPADHSPIKMEIRWNKPTSTSPSTSRKTIKWTTGTLRKVSADDRLKTLFLEILSRKPKKHVSGEGEILDLFLSNVESAFREAWKLYGMKYTPDLPIFELTDDGVTEYLTLRENQEAHNQDVFKLIKEVESAFKITNKSLSANPCSQIVYNGKVVKDAGEAAEALVNEYKAISTLSRTQDRKIEKTRYSEARRTEIAEKEAPHNLRSENLLRPFSREELQDVFTALSFNKSPGIDGLDQIIWRWALCQGDLISEFLSLTWNYFMSESKQTSKYMKCAVIVPIHKAGKCPRLPSSYRPVALLTGPRKFISSIIANRLKKEMMHLTAESQFAYQKGKETGDARFAIGQLLEQQKRNKLRAVVASTDLSKAFDRIKKAILKDALANKGLGIDAIECLAGHITDLNICVKVGQNVSRTLVTEVGIPQGDGLSPLLFIIAYDYMRKIASDKTLTKMKKPVGIKLGDSFYHELTYADDNNLVLEDIAKNTPGRCLLESNIETGNRNNLPMEESKTEVAMVDYAISSWSGSEGSKAITLGGRNITPPTEFNQLGRLIQMKQPSRVQRQPIKKQLAILSSRCTRLRIRSGNMISTTNVMRLFCSTADAIIRYHVTGCGYEPEDEKDLRNTILRNLSRALGIHWKEKRSYDSLEREIEELKITNPMNALKAGFLGYMGRMHEKTGLTHAIFSGTQRNSGNTFFDTLQRLSSTLPVRRPEPLHPVIDATTQPLDYQPPLQPSETTQAIVPEGDVTRAPLRRRRSSIAVNEESLTYVKVNEDFWTHLLTYDLHRDNVLDLHDEDYQVAILRMRSCWLRGMIMYTYKHHQFCCRCVGHARIETSDLPESKISLSSTKTGCIVDWNLECRRNQRRICKTLKQSDKTNSTCTYKGVQYPARYGAGYDGAEADFNVLEGYWPACPQTGQKVGECETCASALPTDTTVAEQQLQSEMAGVVLFEGEETSKSYYKKIRRLFKPTMTMTDSSRIIN